MVVKKLYFSLSKCLFVYYSALHSTKDIIYAPSYVFTKRTLLFLNHKRSLVSVIRIKRVCEVELRVFYSEIAFKNLMTKFESYRTTHVFQVKHLYDVHSNKIALLNNT